MKENWFAILIFSVIFGILGYLWGSMNACMDCCVQSAACCSADECVHVEHDGPHEVHIEMDGGHDEIHAIVETLDEDFVGDTTIVIDGGEIQITKTEDGEMTVEARIEKEHGEGSQQVRKEIRVEVEEE